MKGGPWERWVGGLNEVLSARVREFMGRWVEGWVEGV